METFIVQLRQRVGTTESWTQKDPVLALAEFGMEITITGKILFKLGDGVNKWSQLMYQSKDVYKQEFDNLVMEVANKINGDEVYVKSEVYTKEEVDSAIQIIINTLDTYSRSQIDTKLSVKADEAETIARLDTKADKTEVESALDQKANVLEILSSLNTKADKDNTYTKTETDNAISTSIENIIGTAPETLDTYTKTEIDNALLLKANTEDIPDISTKADKDNTYTKTEIDNALLLKANTSDVNTQINNLTNIVNSKGSAIIAFDELPNDIMPIGTFCFLLQNDSANNANNGLWILANSDDDFNYWREILNPVNEKIIPKSDPIRISGISLNKDIVVTSDFTPISLTATVEPSNATNKNVIWSSSDETIATVDNTGLVTIIGVGTVIITATTVDGNYTDSCTITKNINVVSLSINNPMIDEARIGENHQLTATVEPSNATNKNVIWSSSDETVATVDNTGLVSFIGEGTVTITATTVDGNYTDSLIIQCEMSEILIDQIDITGNDLQNVNIGDTDQLNASISPSNATNKNVIWSSSDETIATVDNTGLVSFISEGTVIITAQSEDSGDASDSVNYTASAVLVTGFELTRNVTGDVDVGGHVQFSIINMTPSNATNKNVIWSSSDETIATVDNTGLVTTIKAGEVIITATAADGSGIVDTDQIICETDVTGVSLNLSTFDGTEQSEPVQLTATVEPSNATNKNVIWSSSDETVATVDNTGLVSFIGEGTVTITATTVDGNYTDSCEFNLLNSESIPVTSCDVINAPGIAESFQGGSYQIETEILPATAEIKTLNYTSSNPSVATVDSNGLVSFVGSGTVRIDIDAVIGNATSFVDITVFEWGYDFQISNTDYDFDLAVDTPSFTHNPVTVDDFYLNPDVLYELYYLGTTGTPNKPVLVPKEGIDAFAPPNPNGTYYINPDNFIVFGFGSVGTKNYKLVKRNI